jgi:hypothetical protein
MKYVGDTRKMEEGSDNQYKKTRHGKCRKYKAISLLSSACKTYTTILRARLHTDLLKTFYTRNNTAFVKADIL